MDNIQSGMLELMAPVCGVMVARMFDCLQPRLCGCETAQHVYIIYTHSQKTVNSLYMHPLRVNMWYYAMHIVYKGYCYFPPLR